MGRILLKKYVFIIFVIVITLFIGAGCSDKQEHETEQVKSGTMVLPTEKTANISETAEPTSESAENTIDNNVYFSITETSDEDSGMMSNVKSIDIQGSEKNVDNAGHIEYTSQYPLTAYDRQTNTIYYSARVYDENNGYGDQLFAYDVETKQSKQLSKNIYAINYIFPVKNTIYMLGAMGGTHSFTIIRYDLDTGEQSVFDSEEKWNFDLLVYDVFSGKLYASATVHEEEEAYIEAYNTRPDEENEEKYTPPDYRIFEFDEDFYEPKEIFHTKNKIVRRMAPTQDGKLFVTFMDSLAVMDPTYESYFINLDTNKLEDAPAIDEVTYVTEFIYFLPDDEKIYFIGVYPAEDQRALCSYDPKSKTIKMIYNSETGYINNCALLRSS